MSCPALSTPRRLYAKHAADHMAPVYTATLSGGCSHLAAPLQGHLAELQEMYAEWPFFQSTFDLIEMILAKADMRISSIYDEQLLESGAKERELGLELRQKFHDTVEAVLQVCLSEQYAWGSSQR